MCRQDLVGSYATDGERGLNGPPARSVQDTVNIDLLSSRLSMQTGQGRRCHLAE
jgi:hypothetical protein